MHVLYVVPSFPSPEYPDRQPFLREQVRLLCQRRADIKRVTVLSPTTFVPAFMKKWRRVSRQATLPIVINSLTLVAKCFFPGI